MSDYTIGVTLDRPYDATVAAHGEVATEARGRLVAALAALERAR